jgi:hypothetical protein
MWKKPDDAVGAQPDVASKQRSDLASLGDALVESFKKGNSSTVPQKVLAEDHNQPLLPPTMKTYTEAVNECTKNASAFFEHLPLLAKARSAYEEAMRASAEIRKLLDAGEESLRTLMTQLEQGVSIQPVKFAPDKKNPESAKVERMRGTAEGGGRANIFP